MARPTRAKDAVVEEICRRVAAGESLRSICRDDHLPAISTVTMWIVDGTQPEFVDRYFKAREAAGYVHADRIQEIAAGLDTEHDGRSVTHIFCDRLCCSASSLIFLFKFIV